METTYLNANDAWPDSRRIVVLLDPRYLLTVTPSILGWGSMLDIPEETIWYTVVGMADLLPQGLRDYPDAIDRDPLVNVIYHLFANYALLGRHEEQVVMDSLENDMTALATEIRCQFTHAYEISYLHSDPEYVAIEVVLKGGGQVG